MSSNGHHASSEKADWWRRHRVLSALMAVAVLILVVGAVAALQLRDARGNLLHARAELEAARDVLSDRDIDGAREHVARAEQGFRRAAGDLDHVAVAPLRVLPVAADNLRALSIAASSARSISDGLGGLLEVVDTLPGGLESLAPVSGRIRLEPLGRLREPLEAFAERLSDDLAAVAEAADRPLLSSVAEALAELREQGTQAHEAVRAAAATVRALPELLGQDRPRRYFFGAGNPAELRGVGGYLGAYAILTVDDGRFTFGDFGPIQELRDVPADAVPPPNPDYAQRFVRYGGAGFWQNINMTADFPSAAEAIITLYEHTEGVRLDGVITADPIALQALAQTTGPVQIPALGQVSPGELVAVLANEAFGEFDDETTRKRVLGAVAAAVFQGFLAGGADPAQAAEALLRAFSGGHVLMYSGEPELQQALTVAGIHGGLQGGTQDYLYAAGVNAGANKLDYYAERTLSYEAVLEPFGSARSQAVVTLANEAPTQDKPRYVIGPNYADFAAGETATIMNLYCGRCAVAGLERDGVTTAVEAERELGHPVFWTYERLRSGESVKLAYRWVVPGAWDSGDYLATYRLVVDGQVTIRPTRLDVRVALPDGMTLVSASHDVDNDGGVLAWSGELGRREEFTFTMRPEGSPVWHALRRWWSDPLVGP